MFLRKPSKGSHELRFWERKRREEGNLAHDHYEQFYTTVFGLSREFYEGKRVLDIGCGPRGSLEWADCATERIGLDPLADDYLKLGADRHKMKYVKAAAESVPFPNGYFDVVTSFNSLDHVDKPNPAILEIIRVVKSGGTCLLIVEINHAPTPTEPLTLRRTILRSFEPSFVVARSWCCAMLPDTHDVYGSVLMGHTVESEEDAAVLCALLTRN
jgi:ubiquinone/menaquinone biosynthesis C-methylase UbiE